MSTEKLTIDTIPLIPTSMSIRTVVGNYNILDPSQESRQTLINIDGLRVGFTLGLEEYDGLWISDDSAWWEQIQAVCGLYAKKWVVPNDGPLLAAALAKWADEAWQEETEDHSERLGALERLEMESRLDDVERYARGKLGLRFPKFVERLSAVSS